MHQMAGSDTKFREVQSQSGCGLGLSKEVLRLGFGPMVCTNGEEWPDELSYNNGRFLVTA